MTLEEVKEAFKNTKNIAPEKVDPIFNKELSKTLDEVVVPYMKELENKRAALMLMSIKKLRDYCPETSLLSQEGSVRVSDTDSANLTVPLGLGDILNRVSENTPVEHLFYEDLQEGRIHTFKTELETQFHVSVPFVHINDLPESLLNSGLVQVKKDESVIYLEAQVDNLPIAGQAFGATSAEHMEAYRSFLVNVNEDTEEVVSWLPGKFQPCSQEFWNRNARKRDLRSQYVWLRQPIETGEICE